MKTAVSVPDDVFERGERLARSAGKSRSRVYADALREYIARHAPEDVTEALDRTVAALGDAAGLDDFVRESTGRTLASTEW